MAEEEEEGGGEASSWHALDRDRESWRGVWPCLSRQRREPEINKRARYLDGVFGIPAGPCRNGFHPKIFRRRNAYFDVAVASKGKDKQARSEDFSPPSILNLCTHVSVCATCDVASRDFQKIYSTARRTRERRLSPSLDARMNSCNHSGRGWRVFAKRELFFGEDKFAWINWFLDFITNIYLFQSSNRYISNFIKL